MDVEAIQEGLATAVRGLVGFDSTSKLQSFASLPGAINPPTFAPTEFELEYHGTFSGRGLVTIVVTCGIFVTEGDTDQGRKMLLGYLAPEGSGSLAATIESDKTLGGTCKTLIAEKVRGAYRLYEVGGIDYLGAMLDVRVWG